MSHYSKATNDQALELFHSMMRRNELLAAAMLASLMHVLKNSSLADLERLDALLSELGGMDPVEPAGWENLRQAKSALNN